MNYKLHLQDARHLIKESNSASQATRREMLQEAKEIIEMVLEEES